MKTHRDTGYKAGYLDNAIQKKISAEVVWCDTVFCTVETKYETMVFAVYPTEDSEEARAEAEGRAEGYAMAWALDHL